MNSFSTGNPSVLAALAISIITIVILLAVVVFQYSKIRDLSKPRYGFLGKPLAIAMVGIISIFSVTGYGFYQNSKSSSDVSVSDPVVPETSFLKIEYTPINESTYLYRFNAVPVIGEVEWGTNADLSFSVEWKIKNTNLTTKTEKIINKDFPGGIIVTLEKGLNTISARMNINGTIYVENINVRI